MFEHLKEIPKRPYTSFVGYASIQRTRYGRSCKAKFPCPVCHGTGQVRDPKDNDAVEGYELATWISCTNCQATGDIGEKRMRALYDMEVAGWIKERDKAFTVRSIEVRALRAISKELAPREIEAIGLAQIMRSMHSKRL